MTGVVFAGISVTQAPPAQAAVESLVVDGMTFTYDDADPASGAMLTEYDSAHGPEVVIPKTVTAGTTDYQVKHIGTDPAGPFRGAGLTAVTIPEGVVSIGDWAFADNQLTSVALPASLTAIGALAFRGNRLDSLVIPEGISAVGVSAFEANQLRSVDLPSSLKVLSTAVFADNLLSNVVLPEGVTALHTKAFANNKITEVHFPDSLTWIDSNAFMTNDLTSVTIPKNVISILSGVFVGNPGLAEVWFEGDAPLIEAPELEFPGNGSFGDSVETTKLFYRCDAEGFTTPLWRGYTTVRACHDVLFVSNGGSSIPAQQVDHLGTVTEPGFPVKEGASFTGWFIDDATTSPYDFRAPVTGGITLHAGWKTDSHTVTFDSQGGAAVGSIATDHGTTVKEPASPVRDGYDFIRWSSDSSGAVAYDFETPVTADVTLYASWRAQLEPGVPATPDHSTTPKTVPAGNAGEKLSATGRHGPEVLTLMGAAVLMTGAVALLVRRRQLRGVSQR